jgi:predicted  nucleic acid-binding Zn-ribbon protein
MMLPDLEHLIHLQQLDDATEEARRTLDELPARSASLDARLADAEGRLNDAKQRMAASQGVRRELDKELASVQGRLTKYKDQLMEVKTNREYQAMQTEIATAEREVRSREDRILENMEEAEALTRLLKEAEGALREEQTAIAAERAALAAQKTGLESDLERLAAERQALRGRIGSDALRLFDYIARQRKGIAVVEAREGHCSICHVRLRPQVFNEIRRNEKLIQCESCHRLLYYASGVGQSAAS